MGSIYAVIFMSLKSILKAIYVDIRNLVLSFKKFKD